MGLFNPRAKTVGVDFAGTVEAIGKDVTTFKVGDERYLGEGDAQGKVVVNV